MTDNDSSLKEASINDNLPNGNPSLRTVLLVFAGIAAVVAMFVLYAEYGS